MVSGSGAATANGVYKASEKLYCDAPVYEHAERGAEFKITREPHKNPKTGAVKHGWLLGKSGSPLYGAPTESLVVPTSGWKKFGGEEPLPTVAVYEQMAEVFFAQADEAKARAETAIDREEWKEAVEEFTAGLEAMKRSGVQSGEVFSKRAARLLSRRAFCHSRLKEQRAALRDAVAALELERNLSTAEALAVNTALELGATDRDAAVRMLEPVGLGRILDPAAPLVLRCVERWIDDVLLSMKVGDPEMRLPPPVHMPSDRYLDGLDEEVREAVIKRYLPDAFKPSGGSGAISSPEECLALMAKWEEVFSSGDFQKKRKELWDRRDLSYPLRLKETRTLVADVLSRVLEPMGFAPGRPGLARVVKQMQVFWSNDLACAQKALDLEELADVSLADLE